jgi:hypothetical protein
MKKILLILVLGLCGCVSRGTLKRETGEAYAKGLSAGEQKSVPYRIAYNQCSESLKDVQSQYYRDLGFKLKQQHEARTDK